MGCLYRYLDSSGALGLTQGPSTGIVILAGNLPLCRFSSGSCPRRGSWAPCWTVAPAAACPQGQASSGATLHGSRPGRLGRSRPQEGSKGRSFVVVDRLLRMQTEGPLSRRALAPFLLWVRVVLGVWEDYHQPGNSELQGYRKLQNVPR